LSHFLAINLQNGTRLLEQWNNNKMFKTWVILHQTIAYVLAFQTSSTKTNTSWRSNFPNKHHQKGLIFHNKEVLKIHKTKRKLRKKKSFFSSIFLSIFFNTYIPTLSTQLSHSPTLPTYPTHILSPYTQPKNIGLNNPTPMTTLVPFGTN
jgi:hypothetical protein